MDREDKIVASLVSIGAYLQREGNRLVAELGINQQQFVVLRTIAKNEPIKQKDICSRLLLEKSNLSKIVKKLVHLDLISISESGEDSRVTLLLVTDAGKTIIDQGMERFHQWNLNWLKLLSETELLHSELALDKLERLIR